MHALPRRSCGLRGHGSGGPAPPAARDRQGSRAGSSARPHASSGGSPAPPAPRTSKRGRTARMGS
ncbi:hypothetical protein [Ornithinimicrobium kibberense]|uniref:hypothetical protein n=1 Tax=Ornithinimicrobium kibberense TaxID=282060 RepID=UPI00361EBDBA